MNCQMIRVISSPSSSTTVPCTLILDMTPLSSYVSRAGGTPAVTVAGGIPYSCTGRDSGRGEAGTPCPGSFLGAESAHANPETEARRHPKDPPMRRALFVLAAAVAVVLGLAGPAGATSRALDV